MPNITAILEFTGHIFWIVHFLPTEEDKTKPNTMMTASTYLVLAMSTGIDAAVVTSPLIMLAMK